MAEPGFTAIFKFTYRGAVEEWSQQYHLDSDFADEADFLQTIYEFAQGSDTPSFTGSARNCLPNTTDIIRFYGYHDTDDPAAYAVDYESDAFHCRLVMTGLTQMPGDTAVWTRWDTERLNSRGRKIYLRKYWHAAVCDETAGIDVVAASQKSALEAFATYATGTGWNGHFLAGPDGNVPGGGSVASQYFTTRTLRRRGRRPTPP